MGDMNKWAWRVNEMILVGKLKHPGKNRP